MAPMLDIVQKRGIMAVFWGLVSYVWDLCNNKTLGVRHLMLYSPFTSITPAVNMKNVLGIFSRAA